MKVVFITNVFHLYIPWHYVKLPKTYTMEYIVENQQFDFDLILLYIYIYIYTNYSWMRIALSMNCFNGSVLAYYLLAQQKPNILLLDHSNNNATSRD